MSFDLGDYKTVAERIAEFAARYPGGCLRPVNPQKPYTILSLGEFTFVVYTAAAYRSPDDMLPGIGCAWELFPGTTPYTRLSELQNAETSAWGRAIVAVLAADTSKSVASADDIRSSPQPATGAAAVGRPRRSPQPPRVEGGGALSPPVSSRAEWEARQRAQGESETDAADEDS